MNTRIALVATAVLLMGCSVETDLTSTTSPDASSSGSGAAGGAAGVGGAGGSSSDGGNGGDPSTGGAGVGGSGTGGADVCDNLDDGPFTPTLFSDALDGSEDLAFDGKGNIAGKQGGNIVLLDSNGDTTILAAVAGTVLGVRYLPNGNLVAGRPSIGSITEITPGGDVSQYAAVPQANGLYADFDSNLWVAKFGSSEVVRVDKDKQVTSIVSGADATQANGIVLHPTLDVLYYTEYSEGKIHRVDVSGETFEPTLIDTISGAALDGMSMDICGNLYIVDNANNKLYRLRLDGDGQPVGTATEIAAFASNIANAQFGSGAGFNGTSIYAAGFPGDVWEVDLGVEGAAVPTAP